MSKKIVIYGAKSTALGVCHAVRCLYPQNEILGFLVSTMGENPSTLAGLPVMEIETFSKHHPSKEKITVLIGTPESIHDEIKRILEHYGFFDYICIDSPKEEILMEQLYGKYKMFPSLHVLPFINEGNEDKKNLQVFAAKSHKDMELENILDMKPWIFTLQAGAELTELRIGTYADNTGENISKKNGNYCELTALYWIWKNVMQGDSESKAESADYYGLFHYRRLLNIGEVDLLRIQENQVDVILPFPTFHEPDIREHHARYIRETDWAAMLQALEELQPTYAAAFPEILKQPYLFNYNLIVARKNILDQYCVWLFPILKRTEELSTPKGWERSDRYIGYLGENLLTLYFIYHQKDFTIVHTGKIMLT